MAGAWKSLQDPQPLQWRRFWLGIGWLLLLTIIIFSMVHNPPMLKVRAFDKIAHFFAYFLLMGWFVPLYTARLSRLAYAGGFIALGCGLEVVQGLGGYRHFEYGDILANSAGVLLGLLLGLWPWSLQHGIERLLARCSED